MARGYVDGSEVLADDANATNRANFLEKSQKVMVISTP